MAVVTVAFSDLNTWLQNQPANTVDTPYELKVTDLNTSDIGKSSVTGTLGYILRQNNTKYVDLSETLIPNDVTTMDAVFQSCKGLVNAPAIPNGVTSMRDSFNGCTSLVNAPAIPNSVTTMGYAFHGCTSLVNPPVIPNSVYYAPSAFQGCTSLAYKPIIPNSVTESALCYYDVTQSAWGVLKSDLETWMSQQSSEFEVKGITLNTEENHYEAVTDSIYGVEIGNLDTWLYNSSANTVDTPYEIKVINITSSNISDLKTALINNGTKYVDLRYTTLPSVTTINSLFRGCSSLVYSPTLPNGVTNMNYCFYDCVNLAECPVIPSSVTSLDYTFNVCRAITTPPVIPSGVTSMARTFGSCSKLVSAPQIPQGVTSLRMTFIYCSSLETVGSFPSNLTSLEMTFSGCQNLSNIPAIPEGVTNMEEAFAETGLTTVPYVPSTVTNGIRAFAYCESLAKIDEFKIPLSALDSSNFQNMFQNCSSLVQIGHKPQMSDSWHVMSLNIDSNTVSGKIYDSEGNDTEINEGTAVSITKDTLSLPNLTDEILFPPSSLSDADLEDTILDVIENKYTYWKKIALDPTKKSFVMYADDPDNFVTNLEMGSSAVDVVEDDNMNAVTSNAVFNFAVRKIRTGTVTPTEDGEVWIV